MKHVGFTGTRKGMTSAQHGAVQSILLYFVPHPASCLAPAYFHHGDCIGADAQAHDLASTLEYWIVLHPPTEDTRRAFKLAQTVCQPYNYMTRNRHIVEACSTLIATPKEFREVLRSGTWSAVRAARKLQRHTLIVWPDGRIEERAR